MSDDELVAKLSRFGFDAQRQSIADRFPEFISAEAMSEVMIDGADTAIPDTEVDWVWIALTCLWERWQPDLPNMEMVDDKMQAGYAALEAGDTLQACRQWLEAWRGILDILDRAGIGSLDEFDERFGGSQSAFNWVQDLEMELHNAGLEQPEFFRERISLCEMLLDRFSDGTLPMDNFKVALAQSHFELGDRTTGDRLFRDWLQEEPQWGSGWISWSDCHGLFAKAEHKDATRAEQILQQGLASPDVENRTGILERLQLLYEDTGRDSEAAGIRREIEQSRRANAASVRFAPNLMQVKQARDVGEGGLPPEDMPNRAEASQSVRAAAGGSSAAKQKVGRNDACPCGSGKKFKKCCARNSR
jgi:hypothetical protein